MFPPAQSSSIMCLIVCDSIATDSSTSKVCPSLLMRVINLFSAVVDIASPVDHDCSVSSSSASLWILLLQLLLVRMDELISKPKPLSRTFDMLVKSLQIVWSILPIQLEYFLIFQLSNDI
ncbi:hypothetical protein LINGRAHAP2_LOCUS33265 [Linum grandiflorum]